MPNTPQPIAEDVLQQAMTCLRQGEPMRTMCKDLHIDHLRLKRALVERFGPEYEILMIDRQRSKNRAIAIMRVVRGTH